MKKSEASGCFAAKYFFVVLTGSGSANAEVVFERYVGRQGRSQIGHTPAFGPLQLVAQKKSARR